MQDIRNHIKDYVTLNENVKVLNESFLGSDELTSVNESEKLFKDQDISVNDDPIKRRKFVLKFLKGLFERAGWDKEESSNSGMYKDMNLWNVTKYVPHLLRIIYKNNKRATELFAPLFKLIDGLHDYSDEFIKDSNDVFAKSQATDSENGLNAIKHAEIAAYLRSETSIDDWTILNVIVWGETLQNLKASDEEVTKALKPLKKLYKDFEIINNGKRDMVMLRGTSKAYLKLMKKLENKWVKKIEAENK